jgi:general stress protein 26
MTTDTEITRKFWKALKSDMTVMLGLHGVADSHSKPMAAQLEGDGDSGPIWFFTAKDTALVQAMGRHHTAQFQFVDKGHNVFATVDGELSVNDDPATIARLWNPFVAAWYEGGQQDPNLQLLRFDPGQAQVWLNENSLFAGIKMLLGSDPKRDYRDKVAEVQLS